MRNIYAQCCEENITDRQIADNQVHIHHMQRRSEGGTPKLNNLRLIHKECHRKIHSLLSRKQMAEGVATSAKT